MTIPRTSVLVRRALVAALVAALVSATVSCSGGTDDAGTDDTGDDAATGSSDASPDTAEDCAEASVDGDGFVLVSVDGTTSVTGTAPDGYQLTAASQPCEVAIVDLLAPVDDTGALATLGLAVDLGPLLRGSVDELADEALGLLVGDDDEILVDSEIEVDGRPARRLEIALSGAEGVSGGTGLLVFTGVGDQVATLTAIATEADYALAAADIEAVLDSLRFSDG